MTCGDGNCLVWELLQLHNFLFGWTPLTFSLTSLWRLTFIYICAQHSQFFCSANVVSAASTLVLIAIWCRRTTWPLVGGAMPQRRRQGAALLFGRDRQHYKHQKRLQEQKGQQCSSESEDTDSDEADGRRLRQFEEHPSLVHATLHEMRENAGRGNGLPEQMKTLIAIRIHKAQSAIAHIQGNRYIAKEEYVKKEKDIIVARKAIEEAMVKIGAITSPDTKQCRHIGKLVKTAMLIVEGTFAKMWDVRSGHSSFYVLETEWDMTSDAFKFHWDKARMVMVEVKIIVLELVRRMEAEEQQAIGALEKVKEDMTTAITSLSTCRQPSNRANHPCRRSSLIWTSPSVWSCVSTRSYLSCPRHSLHWRLQPRHDFVLVVRLNLWCWPWINLLAY